MARRKQNELPKNDFAAEEDLDVCSFTSEPIVTGECISSFSFDDDCINENKVDLLTTNQNTKNINTSPKVTNETIQFNICSTDEEIISSNPLNNKSTSNKNNLLNDNRKAPIVNGMAPPINGEFLDVKRTYMLRASTVRKVNELKSIHPELNAYVSTIVDLAIAHYYEHIINGGSQQ
jgi:hypothetical protein